MDSSLVDFISTWAPLKRPYPTGMELVQASRGSTSEPRAEMCHDKTVLRAQVTYAWYNAAQKVTWDAVPVKRDFPRLKLSGV